MKAELTLKTAKKLYKEGGAGRAFALDNFTEDELKDQCWPTSWEELDNVAGWYVDRFSNVTELNHCYIDSSTRNNFATVEQAQASIALAQLSQLMKAYNGDWEPNWTKPITKYSVSFIEGNPTCSESCTIAHFLAFPDKERRDHFLKHHINLINQAKPLL